MSRSEDLVPLPTGEQIIRFRGAVIDTEEPDLHTYRAQASLVYEQLEHPTTHDTAWRYMMLPDSLWKGVSIRDVRIPTIDVGGGIMIYDIRDFIREYPALAQKYIFDVSTESWRDRKVCALVEGCWNVGIVLFIPPNVQCDMPINIRTLLDPYYESLLIEKIVVIAEANSHVTIIDAVDVTRIGSQLMVRSTDYLIGDYASVTIAVDSRLDESTYEFVRHTIHAGTRSQVRFISFMTGTAQSTLWLDCLMRGRGADVVVRGACALGGNRRLTMTTFQHHTASDAHSDVLIKGGLGGACQFNYSGSINVERHAVKTCARQRNTNLVMSDTARVRSVPMLEVLTNDVHCAHGSAVGQVDEDQVFYAQSRGLTSDSAQRILLKGFLGEVLNDLPACQEPEKLLVESAAYVLGEER